MEASDFDDLPDVGIKLARISEAMSDGVTFIKMKMFIESLPQDSNTFELLRAVDLFYRVCDYHILGEVRET